MGSIPPNVYIFWRNSKILFPYETGNFLWNNKSSVDDMYVRHEKYLLKLILKTLLKIDRLY